MKRRKGMLLLTGMMTAALLLSCGKQQESRGDFKKAGDAKESTTAATAEEKEAATSGAEVPSSQEQPADDSKPGEAEKLEAPVSLSVSLQTERCYSATEDDITVYAEVNYPLLSEEESDRYGLLAEKLKEYQKEAKETLSKNLETLLENAANGQTAGMSYPFLSTWEQATIMRADSRVLSVYIYREDGSGQFTHFFQEGKNFDVQKGEVLQLQDIVTDWDDFRDLVQTSLRRDFEENYKRDFTEEEYFAVTQEYRDFCMDSESVTLFFNPDTLSPDPIGTRSVTIFFEDAPSLFREYYREAPENRVLPYEDTVRPMVLTVGGERQTLRIEAVGDAEGYPYEEAVIALGDRSLTLEPWAYYCHSYVVKQKDKNYLYMETQSDNDWRAIYVIDLQTMQQVGDTMWGSLTAAEYSYIEGDREDRYMEKNSAFVDPSRFLMSFSVNTLSTMTGERWYHVGNDGYPEAEEPWITIASDRVLRLRKDVKVDIVDREGKVANREATLPAGTYLCFVRTDNESYADMQVVPENVTEDPYGGEFDYGYPAFVLKEGTDRTAWEDTDIYRFYVDISTYPSTANGEDEDEVFEGIMYAG